MRGELQSLWLIQGSRSDGDALAADFFKEQGGAALTAEAPAESGHSHKPLQRTALRQTEKTAPAGGRRDKMPAGSPALLAVAGDYVSQRPTYFVADPTASTSTRNDAHALKYHYFRNEGQRNG